MRRESRVSDMTARSPSRRLVGNGADSDHHRPFCRQTAPKGPTLIGHLMHRVERLRRDNLVCLAILEPLI